MPELEEKGWNRRLPVDELIFVDRWGNKVSEEFKKVLESVKI
jgi:hypothetical protein